MPSDPRKRQKKLERRTARRKEKKHSVVQSQSSGLPGQFTAASKLPVLHCWISESLGSKGIGNVLLSREFPNGQVAVATFLIDRYCLGVKDVWMEVMHRTSYENKYLQQMLVDHPARMVSPAEACKFLEDVVEYARGIGLSPHSDYEKAMILFGDTDPAESNAQFEFGKDGKPFFIAGPFDSPERCKQIVAILMNNCGPGQFDYLMPAEGFLEDQPDGYLEADEEEGW